MYFRALAFAALALSLSSCLSTKNNSSTAASAPSGLAYSQNPALYIINEPITPNQLGGSVLGQSYTVSPALPAGLSFDSGKGTITGTPTSLSASATYDIVASNGSGVMHIPLRLTVGDTPPVLAYSGSLTQTLQVGSPVSISTTLSGGALTDCVSSPTLPSGLSLSSSCVISGTPVSASASTGYVITAENTGGSSSLVFNLTVEDVPPAFYYSGGTINAYRGVSLSPVSPTSTGGVATICSVSPSLPLGLSLSNSCVISGTPTVIASSQTYTVTANSFDNSTAATATFNLAVTDIAPVIAYFGNPFSPTVNRAITTLTAVHSGGVITNCTGSLPPGLTLDPATCNISGTPTVISGATLYTITPSNTVTGAGVTLSFSVLAQVPTTSYSSSPFTFPRYSSVGSITPNNSGSPITSCSVSPALPAGLSISSTCVMTGTPSVVQSATLYTITSTNSGGLETTTISIAVSEVVPVISYGGTPFTYTVGVPLSLSSPTNTGGTITGCSVSPALPGGLSLSGACVLSGTPAVISPLTTYTVTATSTAGSGTTTIQITVNSPAPDISYSASPYTYTKGTAIATLTPANSGGAIVSCAISPTQPTGLSFNTATCVLSGTPTASSTAKNYTITATNTGGSSAAIINITVNNAAPTISYSPATYTFTKGTAITTVSATLGGGAVSSCSASPALPVGLAISNTTCAITGTPTATAATASYTITVSSTGGSANAVLSLTVNDAPPVISYTGSPFTYTTGAAISLASPTSSGGAITGCTSNPALPSGLSLSGACVISGTPSVVSSQASYTITASSTGGAGTTAINITVNSPPPNIAYSGSPFVYPVNSLISTLTPANSGGAIVSCSISPALPAGLALSATTCAVSGTPTIVSATTNYTITATNTGGTSSAVVSIQVTSTAPSLTYSTTSYTFTEGTAISTITPTLGGGATTSCTSSPTLPSGLALSNTTCVITGTPTALAATSSYTITASNTGGSATAILSLTVNDKLPVILYSGSPYTFTKNTAITSQTPTNTGGAVLSCSVSPSLPGGLALSSLCVLSGTPTAPTSATVYSVTATNSAGSSSTSITITVQDIAPTLSFAGSPFTYTIGTLVSLTPTTGGGTITNCVSSPALPAGLSLSTSTCAITGNPTNTAVAANYVITALNSGGSAAATINMTVKDIVPAISYAGSPLTLYQNTAMSALTPTSTGGAIVSCTATNLPAGLTISASDCTISGTPTTVAAVVAVTVSAVNTGGTGTASISIKVDSQPPSISYPNSPYTFVKGTVITAVSPANAGGVITGCSVSPAMPAGLSLSTTTCVITGTPSVVSATTTYTVTATNNAGTFVSSAPITLLVIANSPNITYTSTYQNQVFVQGTAITAFSPTNSGGAITSCVISPTLPAGLAINATTCAISGTPTAVAAQNSYTITATNTAGSSNATISLTVNDVPPNITYAGNITANSYGFKPGTTIPTETPTNAGGTIVSCSSNPALPSGLILSTLCVITGNPTTTQTAKNYLISATNSGGTSSITVSMTINSTYPQVQAGRSLASAVSSAFEFTSVNASSSLAAATFSLWSVSAESGDFTKTLVNPDYTALPPLTEPGPYAPRISSDGKRVVYASKLNADGTVSGSYNVWIMNFDGSGKQQLTFNNDPMLDSMAPSFSADGSVIYFSSKMGLSGGWNDHPSESYNVWIMSVDGTQLSPITENALPGLDSQPL